MELKELTLEDEAGIETYVAVAEACRLVDAPWWPPNTVFRMRMQMTHGFDGEVGRHFLLVEGGTTVGLAALYTPEHDNLDQSIVELSVDPAHRRRGHGTEGMRLLAEAAGAMGRTKIAWFGWVGERTQGFAKALGFEPKSIAVCRRQFLHELEPGLADRLYAEALPYAVGYELVRIDGPTPEDLLPALAEATAAINDAPLDDLEMEDEVFTPDRVREFEQAQLASDFRMYRTIARHLDSGEIGGLTVVSVDGRAPAQGHQLDTSVVKSHRGHRLGQLLKADMLRWLAEAEPQLERIDTFNAESNDHMVAVNERLGYRVMDREYQYQGPIAG